ncbi:MAPEG family protein [Sneathiella marina]|uniref:MAPEG family protein n=1 Tax=Sneathiella marina TaxID=2950108 RepID=A0ABY4W9D7_9PROT|nr:MAPEG family protein [Sneathiella marina]USG62738.1 MAPEG family protein [Sneathiella marina]
MTGELFWLAMSAALGLILWIPYTAAGAGVVGFKSGTTDVPKPANLPEWAQRSHRVHMNLVESLAPFAVLVLILSISGKADASTSTAAAAFFFARVAHAIIYTMGIPFLRTVAYTVGWVACLYLLWQILM